MGVSELAQNEALRSLNSMMHNNLFPRMNVPRGSDDVMSGIANGYNMMGTIMEGIRARNDRNRLQELLKQQFGNGENGQPAQNGDGYTVALGDTDKLNTFQNTLGNSLMSEQKPDYTYSLGDTDKLNSFRSIFANNTATPVSNQAPQQDYSMQTFMRNAISKGMLPSNAMQAYSAYLAPVEQDIRQRNVRDAMKVLARRNQGQGISDEDYYDAMAKLNYNLGEDYALKDNNAIIDQMSKVQSGLLSPIGAMHDPEKYRKIGYPINLNMWDQLKNTIGVNYGNGFSGGFSNNSLSSGGSEYGGDNENARAIYTYFKNKGYSDNVIAGIMGNIQAESQFNPTIGYGDGGTSGGLAQWHDEQPGVGRWSNLKNFAVNRQMDWKDLTTQLDFMVDEINKNYPDLIQKMSKLSPNEAAILFHDTYERSQDLYDPVKKARRGTYADEIYNRRRLGENIGTYNMPTQGANIDEQVKQLKPELQQVLPTIGGILKNKFGVDGVISSGARSKERQMQVNPSAPNSYHVYGDAVDIVLPDNTTPEQYKQIEDYFKSTGQFAEVDNHDKGSGFHLHLGGYKGGNIGNTSGGYSYQPQQRPSFANAFNPQVVSGQGAILNPMVLYKALTEQAEKQRLQDNANRQFEYNMFNDNRNYKLNKERVDLLKQQAAAKQKQEDLSKYQLYNDDELYKEGLPIATLNNLIASPLKDDATDEQKQQYQTNMLNAVNSFAQYNVPKYKDLIAKGYSEQDAQTILRNGITNAVGRSFMASQGGNSDAKKYMIEKAVSDIYYRTMGLVAQDKEALSKPSSVADFKKIQSNDKKHNLNDYKYAEDQATQTSLKKDREILKKLKYRDAVKEIMKDSIDYDGMYIVEKNGKIYFKAKRGYRDLTKDKMEKYAKEIREKAERETQNLTDADYAKYKDEIKKVKTSLDEFTQRKYDELLGDTEASMKFNNEDNNTIDKYKQGRYDDDDVLY